MELRHEHERDHRHAHRQTEDGEYKIPKIIYSDAYFSETVPYADLILPDTTYLERWDAISMLDRPISGAEGAADSIRQPVVQPDRDVRPFQEILLEIGVGLGLPGMKNEDGSAKFPGGYSDYIVNHERTPGVGTLMGWRGENGDQSGKGGAQSETAGVYRERLLLAPRAQAERAVLQTCEQGLPRTFRRTRFQRQCRIR